MEYINGRIGNTEGGAGGGGGLYRQFPAAYNYSLPYTIPWADTASDAIDGGAAGGGGGNL